MCTQFTKYIAAIICICLSSTSYAAWKTDEEVAAEAAEKGITELLDNKGTKEWWSEIGKDQFASDFSTKVDILIKSKNA